MKFQLALCALLAAAPLHAAQDAKFDPNGVSEADASCDIDVPSYNSFAMAISGDDDIAGKRDWRKIESGNPFMYEYELPVPILVTGNHSTRRIGFTSSAIVAILDIADPADLAREQKIDNALDPDAFIDELVASGAVSRKQAGERITFRKFLGEKIISDTVEPPEEGGSFGVHSTITRTISTVSTHPGKTLYGCSYRIELLDKNGQPI